MALRCKALFFGLLALLPGLQAADASLPSPQNVTLTVDDQQSGTLLWDPIDRDDLMGYSIWMRQGKGDYTRLIIPTTVHGELKKLPMTSKSILNLKGVGRRDLEIEVVSEYESGESAPSISVFSKKARHVASPLSATAKAGTPAATEAVTASAQTALTTTAQTSLPSKEATPESKDDEESPASPVPGNAHLRPTMAAPGTFHTSIRAQYSLEHTEASGYNSLLQLGRWAQNQPASAVNSPQNWTSSYSGSIFSIPISAEYGILPALEIGAMVSYDYDDFSEGNLQFGSNLNSEPSGLVTTGGNNASPEIQDPSRFTSISGGGFSNPALEIKIQPSMNLPLWLSLWGSIPTGQRSRLQAFEDFVNGVSDVAGMDDNVTRLRVSLEFGQKGLTPGLFYKLSYMPAATENLDYSSPATVSLTVQESLVHGEEIEGGLGYCIPWWQDSSPGNLSVGFNIKSVDAALWTANGNNVANYLNDDEKAEFRAFTGSNLDQESLLELYADLTQNIYSNSDDKGNVHNIVDSGGKLAFTVKPDNGWILSISGGFYY